MKTLDDVFACWPTMPEMASDTGASVWQAKKWRQRGRIPATHWPAVQAALSRKGKKLSADALLAMHSHRRSA